MKTILIALRYFIVLTLLTGIIYPALVTVIGNGIWPSQASGSLIEYDGKIIGSRLIAQKFVNDTHFWPRPSAADYNASASSGSNKGPTNSDLKQIYADRIKQNLAQDMIFSSGSGLDPHISPESAYAQIDRIATARALTTSHKNDLEHLIQKSVEGRTFGFLGEKRVNVLMLNLALKEMFSSSP